MRNLQIRADAPILWYSVTGPGSLLSVLSFLPTFFPAAPKCVLGRCTFVSSLADAAAAAGASQLGSTLSPNLYLICLGVLLFSSDWQSAAASLFLALGDHSVNCTVTTTAAADTVSYYWLLRQQWAHRQIDQLRSEKERNAETDNYAPIMVQSSNTDRQQVPVRHEQRKECLPVW